MRGGRGGQRAVVVVVVAVVVAVCLADLLTSLLPYCITVSSWLRGNLQEGTVSTPYITLHT